MGLIIPLVYWLDAYNTKGWATYESSWMDPVTTTIVVILCLSLFLIPLCWVVTKRVIDSMALVLGQQALIFGGYYYLDQTAAHFPDWMQDILSVSGLVILFNAVGFLSFFIALGTVYQLIKALHYPLRPLDIPAAVLDRRLLMLGRLLSVLCAVSIASPMILNHNIPLFASDYPMSREDLIADSSSRAFFQASGALLPFVTAILVIGILRARRFISWDSFMVFFMLTCQLLTSNRLALAIAVATTLSAVTMHFRIPRWLLVPLFAGYLFSFTLLSGFTSLVRLNPHVLEDGNWISDSIEEAYLGDNIIDLRDGSWVFSKWDYEPLMGKTYLGGALSMVPSGLFPEKKQWHLGMTGVRIVGMPEEQHFGLRVTFFGEAFLNFGWAGVILLGTLIGSLYAVLLRQAHLIAQPDTPSCLYRNITLLILLQCLLPLSNSSDGFIFWAQVGLLFLMWLTVVFPLRWSMARPVVSKQNSAHPHEPSPTGA